MRGPGLAVDVRVRTLLVHQDADFSEALWGRETMAGMAHGCVAQGNCLDGEVGYTGCRWAAASSARRAGPLQHLGARPGLPGRLRLSACSTVRSLHFELGVEARHQQRGARAGHAGLVEQAAAVRVSSARVRS